MTKRFMIAVVALALCTGAFAQGRGGGMMRMGGGDPTMLLRRGDVQKDLGLTDDQKTKLTSIQDKARADMQAFFQANSGGGERPDFEKLRPQMEKMRSDIKKQVDEILTPDQVKRLGEISIQLGGNRAVLRKEVQEQLGLTAEQREKLKDLQSKEQAAMQELRDKVQNGDVTREQMRTLRTKNGKIMDDMIGKILNDDQRSKLKALGGKPFEAEKQEDSGGGRGD